MTSEPVAPTPVVPTCYRHPGRETHVRCTRCDRPICPECMREASVGFQCPECVAGGRRTERRPATWFGGGDAGQRGYVTIALVALNVAVFLIGVVVSHGQAIQQLWGGGFTTLHLWGAVFGPSFDVNGVHYTGIDDGGYYRLVTAMFLHYGPLHLLMNMWALWLLGRNLEYALGPVRFLALYLLAGIGGNVAAYVFSPTTFSAGASTALFGLFAALFLVLRRLGRDTSALIPVIVINLIFTFTVHGISIAGHIGGFVTGAVVAAGLAYAPRQNRTLVQGAVLSGVFVALAVVTMAVSVG